MWMSHPNIGTDFCVLYFLVHFLISYSVLFYLFPLFSFLFYQKQKIIFGKEIKCVVFVIFLNVYASTMYQLITNTQKRKPCHCTILL